MYTCTLCKTPHELDFLRDQQISFIACGQNHSVFHSLNGKVFTLSKNSVDTIDSRLEGHAELEDRKIICGRWYTLAFIPSSNNLYIFGPKSLDDTNFTLVEVKSLSEHFSGDTLDANGRSLFTNIYCGGPTCYFITSEANQMGNNNPNTQDEHFSEQVIYQLDTKSISELSAISHLSVVPDNIEKAIQNLFSSSACLNASFLRSEHYCCNEENSGLNLVSARKTFKRISRKHNILSEISKVIHTQLSPTLLKSPPGIEALRLYLLLLEFPTMQFPELYLQSIISITKALCNLSPEMSKVIDTWIGNLLPGRFKHLIITFKNVVVHLLSEQRNRPVFTLEWNITIALDMLKKLNKIFEEKEESIEHVSYTSFYIPEVNLLWEGSTLPPTSVKLLKQFLEKYPFILENTVKMHLILIDSQEQKMRAVNEESFFWRMLQGIGCNMFMINPPLRCYFFPLSLTIDRQDIVDSTLRQLNRHSERDYKKPLRVIFKDELGIDDGGPHKEFFQEVFKKIFDPQFGMFKEFSTGTVWFNPQSPKDWSMFRMVGLLCGLAIYNQVIVNLPFPLALYKKLLERPVYLTDMKELDKGMAKCLKAILDYDDYDLQDAFNMYFQVSTEFRGEVNTFDLKEGGKDIPLNYDNKQEYVDLYIDCIFNESVKDQYSAFAEGFLQVCGGPVLQKFHPQELKTMVVGNDLYDWKEFERSLCSACGGPKPSVKLDRLSGCRLCRSCSKAEPCKICACWPPTKFAAALDWAAQAATRSQGSLPAASGIVAAPDDSPPPLEDLSASRSAGPSPPLDPALVSLISEQVGRVAREVFAGMRAASAVPDPAPPVPGDGFRVAGESPMDESSKHLESESEDIVLGSDLSILDHLGVSFYTPCRGGLGAGLCGPPAPARPAHPVPVVGLHPDLILCLNSQAKSKPVAAPRRLTAGFPVPEDQYKQFIQVPPIPRAAKGRLREDQKLSSTSKVLFSNKAQGAAEEALAFVDRTAREGICSVNGAGFALSFLSDADANPTLAPVSSRTPLASFGRALALFRTSSIAQAAGTARRANVLRATTVSPGHFDRFLDCPSFGAEDLFFCQFAAKEEAWARELEAWRQTRAKFPGLGVLEAATSAPAETASVHRSPQPLSLLLLLLTIMPVYLTDMKELDKGMAKCLKAILDYDAYDLQDAFNMYFQVSTEFRGEVDTFDLKEGGKDIPLNYDNKQEYVDLYIDCIFNESVKDQYSAFAEGFLQVCGGPVLQKFHPQELKTMVVGNDIYDWKEFERLVVYRDIFSKKHKTIKFFWQVFHDFTLQEKKKFLAFLTGSDRIPVQGMSRLKMIIRPVFESTDYLPTAQTCFNIFELPLYKSKEKMREKLLKMLEHGKGFGLQ
ncbi:probable E3 ubiquitin-protein ligase HERC3 [Anneissia japonica]|uniref:probable E3 ubiquitin-protein ligase HERC3 n=1 Tax=Anneissia japonica TaxID=1529436 RepID=UPI00142564F9|nr:probable E3 ubiquitin-protein ligase HERC3 [Anneissia japonica]